MRSARLRSALLETRTRLVLLFVTGLMAVFASVRLALVVLQRAPSRGGWLAVLRALEVGVVFDLVTALWLAAPLVLFLAAVPERWFHRRGLRALVFTGFGMAVFGVLFVAVAEVFFFEELNARFNFVAVDYLMYPTEVAVNIWESYPTGLVLGVLAATAGGAALVLPRLLRSAWQRPMPAGRRVGATLGFCLAASGLTWAVPPGMAHISQDRALNEIAANGYYSFWTALLGSNATYQGLYATRGEASVFGRLRGQLAEPAADPGSFVPGSTLRHIRALGPERRMNVVVVLEESLGSELVGTLHPRPVSLTPHFDALAREGTLLTRAYSTGNRTIRAIEATTSSLPPLPGVSIVRRPQSRDLFTLPALLRERGYQTQFVYGGRALFDGMGRYLRANGIDRVVEQKDFPAGTFRTAWGVADQAIFDRALAEMDAAHARGKPFYTLILSVSNHRPFLFPEEGIARDPSLQGRENAVRYADWALGRFIRQARRHAFFDNTLFVLMGDHGARVYGAPEIPLGSYEVPILFYAPGVVPAGRQVDTLACSLDVPPTVLGLLGVEYDSRFFGHDVLRIDPSEGRALMTHNSAIALMKGSRIGVLGLRRSARVFAVASDGSFVPRRVPGRADRELIEDAIAWFEGADTVYRSGAYAMTERSPERLASTSPPARPGGPRRLPKSPR